MAPVLVEMPVMSYTTFEHRPAAVPAHEETELFIQPVEEQFIAYAESKPAMIQEEKKEEIPLKLVIKNEEPAKEPVMMKIGERVLSQDEIEEKKRFEEQKKALEDRAERLRRMSFNIKGTESSDEMEAVPAYMRKNMKLDNQQGSADTFYSGYTVGVNDQQNSPQAAIQTINTFLDGKKPD